MANFLKVQLRVPSNSSSGWGSVNPILLKGEIGWESDTNKIKIGDGVTPWTDLDYVLGSDDGQTPLEVENRLSFLEENVVLKEEGKGLSTNDFTDELKEELEGGLQAKTLRGSELGRFVGSQSV